MVLKWYLFIVLIVCSLCATNCDSLSQELNAVKAELADVKTVLRNILDGNSVEEVLPEAKARLKQMDRERQIYDSLMALTYEIPLSHSPVLGPENAPVTIIEFSDFACPYCFQASQELDRLVSDFPDKIRVIFKHFPLPIHKESPAAHKASLAAAQLGKFWEYRFLLPYKYNQLTPEILLKGAQMAGMKKRAFKKALMTVDTSIIDEDVTLGTILSVDGTPTFFINGKRYAHFSYENVVRDFQLLPSAEVTARDSSCNCDLDD